MGTLSMHHKELTDGEGKCSVPMWGGGCPDGFCDNPAYGNRPKCKEWYNHASQQTIREDFKYSGYVPGLACHGHGGPERNALQCKGENCKTINGAGHSEECKKEYDRITHYPPLDTAGNRNPEARYAGYKNRPLADGSSDDEVEAWNEGQRARL